jgi:hypothetical protein
MWDVDTDVPAVLDDYFAGMYGPAAAPMRTYFETLRDIARERYIHGDLLRRRGLPAAARYARRGHGVLCADRQAARARAALDRPLRVRAASSAGCTSTPTRNRSRRSHAFVEAHPDSLGFDRKMHRSEPSMRPPERTEVAADLRYEGPAVVPAAFADAPAEASLSASPAVRGMPRSGWRCRNRARHSRSASRRGRWAATWRTHRRGPARALGSDIVEALNVGVKTTGTIARCPRLRMASTSCA